jgi:sorbitol-specific phosphotransferase system component IIC
MSSDGGRLIARLDKCQHFAKAILQYTVVGIVVAIILLTPAALPHGRLLPPIK